jgi:hypothetical protein
VDSYILLGADGLHYSQFTILDNNRTLYRNLRMYVCVQMRHGIGEGWATLSLTLPGSGNCKMPWGAQFLD